MSERLNCDRIVFKDLGLLEYNPALDLQFSALEAKLHDPDTADHIFLVEHPKVFTLGKNGGLENLSISQKDLRSKNIPVIQTKRGGNITYHCPGQIVVYPVISLEKRKMGVKEFVYHLEEALIQTVMHFDIQAVRNPLNHGIWVDNCKLGSIGLGIKKNISFHGMAVNINPDMEPFSWMNPCGLNGISMTCLKKELEKNDRTHLNISMPQIKDLLKKQLGLIFG